MSLKQIFGRVLLTGLCVLSFNGRASHQLNPDCKYDPHSKNLILEPASQYNSQRPWNKLLSKMNEVITRQACIIQDTSESKMLAEWFSRFDSLRGKPFRMQVTAINQEVNRYVSYEHDSILYKTRDYWASPIETIKNRQGDCEDFAILKYAALLHVGAPKDRFYLACTDSVQGNNMSHAVVLVDFSQNNDGSRIYVLDNGYFSPLYPLTDFYWPKYVYNDEKTMIAARTDDARFFGRAAFSERSWPPQASLAIKKH